MTRRTPPDAPVNLDEIRAQVVDAGKELHLKDRGEIARLNLIITEARTALEEGRRGDALKILRKAASGSPWPPAKAPSGGSAA